MVLLWQPPSYFSQSPPPSFVVGKMSFSCAEQYMMAEKARLFQDHHAAELILSSPDPRNHKRIGRGLRRFDSVSRDCVQEDAVLAGTFAKSTQKPVMEQNLFRSLPPKFWLKPVLLTLCGHRSLGGQSRGQRPPPGRGETFIDKKYFYRPRCHSHKKGRTVTPRLLYSILRSDLARRTS